MKTQPRVLHGKGLQGKRVKLGVQGKAGERKGRSEGHRKGGYIAGQLRAGRSPTPVPSIHYLLPSANVNGFSPLSPGCKTIREPDHLGSRAV